MFKIRSLILLLISLTIISCASKKVTSSQFNLKYIEGGESGVLYANYLKMYLKSLDMLNDQSGYSISTSINHEISVFITNVNNTSDREMITSTVKASIKDEDQNCLLINYENNVKQFYVITSNINSTSNTKAVENIKKNNSEILAKEFAYYLAEAENFECKNDKKY